MTRMSLRVPETSEELTGCDTTTGSDSDTCIRRISATRPSNEATLPET